MRNYIIFLTILTLLMGCTGQGNPVSPDLATQKISSFPNSSSPQLLGLWDISIDPATGIVSAIPVRNSNQTMNVTMFLQPPAGKLSSLGIEILDSSGLISQGRIDIRVTLHHPFSNSKLRGFDVRGVVMGNGTHAVVYNNSIIYPGSDDLLLLNSDGYTRWMNPSEFTTPGILGYVPGAMGSSFIPSATINAYKYFAELIEPGQSVYDYFASSHSFVANRGSMRGGDEISRDYYLKFPVPVVPIRFQYAIIASWEKATSGGDTPSVLDFPQSANAFEPVGFEITDNSDVYFESSDKKGGNINLDLKIVDWWAEWEPGHLSDYIDKIYVSSTETILAPGPGMNYISFSDSDLVYSPTSAGNCESVNLFIPNVVPSSADNQPVLIAVQMKTFDYSNPWNIPNDASDSPLTAYFLYNLPVSPEFNDPPVINNGVTGPSNAFLTDIDTYTVDATDSDSPSITYEWTITDPLTDEILEGPSAGDGLGNWEIDWATVYTPGVVLINCVVSDGENIVSAESLSVDVSDVIFHADLADTVTGDNAGWSAVEEQGSSFWTSFTGSDNILKGHGYKFGQFNTIYTNDSAGILTTPAIGIPPGVDRAMVVVFHSYEWEYYEPLEIGFDGGNFKVTEYPDTPVYADPEAEIIGGKAYDGWLFDTAISDQQVFYSNQFTDEVLVSAFEIPASMIGSQVYLGFACASDMDTIGEFHGWLIDDVQIRALPDGANAPPIAGSPVTGDEIVPMLNGFSGHYEVVAYDLEDDPLTFAWTVKVPGSSEVIWGPQITSVDNIDIDWNEIGIPADYEVHVSIYDGQHPGVAADPLTVETQEVIFHADFSDTVTGDNVGWSGILESGATSWTDTVGSDSALNGYGCKWAGFNANYAANSQGILLSPPIPIPSGVSRVSLYVRHDFEFLATLDGGNFKVTKFPTQPGFATSEEQIDGGFGYDIELNGTVMDNQWSFGIGQTNDNGLLSRMDLANSYQGQQALLGCASASGTVNFGMRGWMIDDVLLAISP